MTEKISEKFIQLFKLYRNRSRDPLTGKNLTQSRLADLLSQADATGFVYTAPIISRWENGKRRINNKNRHILIALLQTFYRCGGITIQEEANALLQAGLYLTLTDTEVRQIEPAWLGEESFGSSSEKRVEPELQANDNSPPPPLPDPEIIFTNIWYTDRRYTFSTWIRDYMLGTLYIRPKTLHYVSDKVTISITNAASIEHTRQYSDVNANWVKVVYFEGDIRKEAWFAEGKKLGWGNLVGGSHELFVALKQWGDKLMLSEL